MTRHCAKTWHCLTRARLESVRSLAVATDEEGRAATSVAHPNGKERG